jgi:pyruvate dehydrogenase E1 component beta subunit
VIFLEHRWLHGISDHVPEGHYRVPLGKARVVREGADATIVATSYMVLESLRAADFLSRDGIHAEVIDLRTLRPLDENAILESVRKTGRLVVADTGWKMFGASAEILALVTEQAFSALKASPRRIASPDFPVPTSPALSDDYYPRAGHIATAVFDLMGRKPTTNLFEVAPGQRLDQPDASFVGPF